MAYTVQLAYKGNAFQGPVTVDNVVQIVAVIKELGSGVTVGSVYNLTGNSTMSVKRDIETLTYENITREFASCTY